MSQRINITLAVNDNRLAESVQDMLRQVADADVTLWNAVKPADRKPDIILVDDDESGLVLRKLPELRRDFPETYIFVVSPNKNPQHIVQVMKAGGSEYLMAPIEKESLLNAINEIRVKLDGEEKPSGSVYSFISSKGGLGSTFLAVNTAEALALPKKQSIALWDMSFQSGDSSVLLDIIPETTIIDICKNIHRLDFALLKSAMMGHNGIDLLCAPKRPEESEDITANHIDRILNLITRLYEHVIIDCTSMSITDSTIKAFEVSAEIFIVIDLSVPAIRNGARIYELIRQMGIDQQKIEFIVNRHVSSGTLSIDEAERTLGKHVFWLFPNDFDSVISSINNGEPLINSAPRCALSKSIVKFTNKISHPGTYKNSRGTRKRRFFSRAFS